MMKLTTMVLPQDGEQQISVAWRTGLTRKGIVQVEGLNDTTEDKDVIAELLAIKYLLFTKQVFDRLPLSGLGYELVVSRGAIKKAAQGRTSKKHLIPHAAFLNLSLSGAEITIDKKKDPHLPELASNDISVQTIHAGGGYDNTDTYDTIETPAHGKLRITRHALDQFTERLSTGDPKRPYKALVDRLSNPELELKLIPEKVLQHKARKYGSADNLEVWGHRSSQMNYVVVKEDVNRVLVTVFRR